MVKLFSRWKPRCGRSSKSWFVPKRPWRWPQRNAVIWWKSWTIAPRVTSPRGVFGINSCRVYFALCWCSRPGSSRSRNRSGSCCARRTTWSGINSSKSRGWDVTPRITSNVNANRRLANRPWRSKRRPISRTTIFKRPTSM